eukprot:COSAG02_NODE_12236_length_1575_cov_3.685783_2_plen_124_part_01
MHEVHQHNHSFVFECMRALIYAYTQDTGTCRSIAAYRAHSGSQVSFALRAFCSLCPPAPGSCCVESKHNAALASVATNQLALLPESHFTMPTHHRPTIVLSFTYRQWSPLEQTVILWWRRPVLT